VNTVPSTAGSEELIAALQQTVIDPDLGVNVVDLGFIRHASIEEGTASLVMTLTSLACPLTKVIEEQARTAVIGTLMWDLKIEWAWGPAWSPQDIQLTAIGFSFNGSSGRAR